jgi:hypothetical protein
MSWIFTTKTTNSMIFTNNIEMREKWDKYVGAKKEGGYKYKIGQY